MAWPTTLDYGTQPTRLRKWRRRLFWVGLATAVLAVGLLVLPLADHEYQQWKYRHAMVQWYAKVANFTAPERELEYFGGPEFNLASQYGSGSGWSARQGDLLLWGMPPDPRPNTARFGGNAGSIFASEMKTQMGGKAVVLIIPTNRPVGALNFAVCCFVRTSRGVKETSTPYIVPMPGLQPQQVRLRTGQRDPQDGSRFSIPMSINGAGGWIDGVVLPGPSASSDPKIAIEESMLNSTINFTVRMGTVPATLASPNGN